MKDWTIRVDNEQVHLSLEADSREQAVQVAAVLTAFMENQRPQPQRSILEAESWQSITASWADIAQQEEAADQLRYGDHLGTFPDEGASDDYA